MSASSIASRPNIEPKPIANTTLHGPLLWAARVAAVIIFGVTWYCFLRGAFMQPEAANMLMTNLDAVKGRYYTVGLDFLLMIVSSGVACMIVWHKSNDWMGLLVAVTLVTFGASGTSSITLLGMQAELNGVPLSNVILSLGLGTILLFLYLFPNGRFVPNWTRYVAIGWTAWFVTWPFIREISPIGGKMPIGVEFGLLSVFYISGVLAQAYRRQHVFSEVERQQTKWAGFGMLIAFIGFFLSNVFIYVIRPMDMPAGTQSGVFPFIWLVLPLFTVVSYCAIPVTAGMSLMKLHLWDIDPLIHRTTVYALATGGLAIVFFAEVFIFQAISHAIIGQQSDVALVASTLIIAVLFQPARQRMQAMIDRRFYREKVDFQQTFTDLSHQIRTIIDQNELSDVLINRVSALLHITYGAVFLREADGSFGIDDLSKLANLCEKSEAPALMKAESIQKLPMKAEMLVKLQAGHAYVPPKEAPWSLLVPLIAPRAGSAELVGVLAYGPRRSGQDYSRDDQVLLRNLADQAGTAMYVARLIEEKQAEADLREEAERALETHRNSPVGRAEVFAAKLVAQPELALAQLHGLVQKAGTDPETASLVSNLNHVLVEASAAPIAQLANGYNYLYNGLQVPELLLLGLRTLIAQLETSPTKDWQDANTARVTYHIAEQALTASTVSQITGILPGMRDDLAYCLADALAAPSFLADLLKAMEELKGVAETLHAYERVDTSQDKLTYLVSALERLSRIDRSARAELGSADRGITLRTTEKWFAIVSGVMSEIQTRAQIACRLLTHHTWQDDVISLALSIRNSGRGAALNIRVNLAPMPDYVVVDPAVIIDRLAPDEETQVELRVRPRLEEGVDQFRARFIVQYADPRGPDQIENFADVVYMLTSTAKFEYIPNPYVIGTPLQTRSPLFFGRADVVAFIKENLAAEHRNNLVLIGQRRTGKTSLLKQLPAHLGTGYLPVYLDGQALSLDPGMNNFFLNLATEIAFAIEDHGLTAPEMPNFNDSPAATFERVFLVNARKIIGDRHLLILFDEFEELESAVQRGNLDSSVFGFLRHLIQHGENISVIFCGTHRMEELASDYWSVLFNISLYRHIGFLEQTEAMRLIQEPVAKYGMRYDDLALDKMWRVTAGHPYFLQLLCHSLVNRHNKTQRNYLTIADINAALDDILASGEAHFVYMWMEAAQQERLVLTALSRSMLLTGRATLVQVMDYLEERGIHADRKAVDDALHKLVLMGVLTTSAETDMAGETYRWRLGLLGLWVEKYKSLSRVADEVRV